MSNETTFGLQAFIGKEWREIPGYQNLVAADTNFYSGIMNRTSNYLVRAVRHIDGQIFCGRVPEEVMTA